MRLSDDEYRELINRVSAILGEYSRSDKHILAVRFEQSKLFSRFLESLQYEYVDKRSEELVSKVLDCLEY